MAVSLEQYISEATNAYAPAKTAVQNQIGALEGNYNTGAEKINRNYERQQENLVNQRNWAAEDASMAAAARGSGFGGQAEAAARNYYEKTFVPAQTQMDTNKSNELDTLRQNIENQRASLNSQLANIDAQANQAALQQYWAAVEAEKQREAELQRQREAQAAQNAFSRYLMDAMKNQGGNKVWDFGGGYTLVQGDDGRAYYKRNGEQISAASFLYGTANNGNKWNLWNDVWNNGVNTYGVGGDTIDAFGRGRLSAKGLSNYVDLARI